MAIGAVESRQIGPRSLVWAEPELLDLASSDFSETENMLRAIYLQDKISKSYNFHTLFVPYKFFIYYKRSLSVAEELAGPYVWERFDILVLPPFFPWGGMENPCLTFVTPTLLSGDKSNAFVIAHEIAHSWTGNLVTNKNMEHFWINEGFDVFLHRKILGRLSGELVRHFDHELHWTNLEEDVQQNLGPDNPFTALVTNLTGVHPDEAFSWVPYEKGSAFLWHLEETVGGPDIFEPFLRAYIQNFAYQSIDTDDFLSYFKSYFKER